MSGPDLFTLGEVLAVFLADEGLPLSESRRFRRTTAGSEINVAAGLARLGRTTTMLTAVGYDGLGVAVTTQARGWGVDLDVVRIPDAVTGTIVRDLGSGSRGIEVAHLRAGSAARHLSPDHVRSAWPGQPRVLFLTGITAVLSDSALSACLAAADLARRDGALVVLDPNLRPRLAPVERFRDAVGRLLPFADVVVAGEDELTALSDRDTPQEVAADLVGAGVRLVVAKRGADGAWARQGDLVVEQRAVPTTVVDPVGAGDAFAVGLIHGLLDDADLAESLRLGASVAGFVVGTPGDIEGLPTVDALASALDSRDVVR